MRKLKLITAALFLISPFAANAVPILVTVTGTVEFNQINTGPLMVAGAGDAASISMQLDSDSFLDSLNFPTRGYAIDPGTFMFTAGGGTVGMQSSLPPGVAPMFIIRNDDPAVDGFFLGTNVDGFNDGVPTDSVGIFDNFRTNFLVTYGDDPLASLNILDALGTYGFAGLTVFNFTVDDGPFNAMGLVFDQMTIAAISTPVPEPGTLALLSLGLFGMGLARRRKKV